MKTLREIFTPELGYNFKNFRGRFGLEVETEVLDKISYKGLLTSSGTIPHGQHGGSLQKWTIKGSKYWHTVEDGSLRNYGLEHIFIEPIDFEKIPEALDEFERIFKDVPFIQGSASSSVHVHMNMLDETPLVLANVIATWTMFENPLVDFCGDHRRSNLFGLPIRCAEDANFNHIKLLKGLEANNPFPFQSEESAKYSALNICPLSSKGSIEIRCMRGTTDMSIILKWINILQKILVFAKMPGLTPYDILQEYNLKGMELFDDIFWPYSNTLRSPETEAMIDRNLFYVQNIVESIQNWDKFAEYPTQKPKALRKKLSPLASPHDVYASSLGITPPQPTPIPWGHATLQAQPSQGIDWATIDDIETSDDPEPLPELDEDEEDE